MAEDNNYAGSFEDWLGSSQPENIEFNENFKSPINKNEAFSRYGMTGLSFYTALKEAEWQPKKDSGGNVKVKQNPLFKAIDVDKAWQLWEQTGQPYVQDKGYGKLLTDSESSDLSFSEEQISDVNNVLKEVGKSIGKDVGSPIVKSMMDFESEEIDFVDENKEPERARELFTNVSEKAIEIISGAMEVLADKPQSPSVEYQEENQEENI